MSTSSKDKNRLSGKGEKAKSRLDILRDEVTALTKVFNSISNTYKEVEPLIVQSTNTFPIRLDFEIADLLNLYLDIIIAPSETDSTMVEGYIIYGVHRTLCFTECKHPKNGDDYRCDRIARCDGWEDKPLIRFKVNQYGEIVGDELDDKWYVKQNVNQDKKHLADLHYRAIDHIWNKASEWTNEKLLS